MMRGFQVILTLLVTTFLIPSLVHAAEKEGFNNSSEAGVQITRGNSKTDSLNLKQENAYISGNDIYKGRINYLRSAAKDELVSKDWLLGIRYERELEKRIRGFAGQNIEGHTFAGELQQYTTDVGGKYFFEKSDELNWFAEAGYRYMIENQRQYAQLHQHYLRAYSEISIDLEMATVAKLWVEALPNLSDSANWQGNWEVSISSALGSLFSLKLAYLWKYDHKTAPGAISNSDSSFITSVVAIW